MSETPRTDRWIKNINGWHYVQIERCRELEHELNVANERIKRLEEMYEGEIGENEQFLGSNLQGLLTRELNWSKERIKRLEEAGDKMADLLRWQSRMDRKTSPSASAWRKAKEDKP